jgi:hypothetical protein
MIVAIHRAYFDDVVVYADTLGLFTGEGEGDLKKVLDELGAFAPDIRLLLYPGVGVNEFGFVVEQIIDGRWQSIRAGDLVFHGACNVYGACFQTAERTFGWSIVPAVY